MAQKKNSKHQHGATPKGSENGGAGIDRKLHDPVADRLIPLAPLDLSEIHSIDDLVRAMSKTAFTGRQLGEAADVLEAMARDQDAFVVMTLAAYPKRIGGLSTCCDLARLDIHVSGDTMAPLVRYRTSRPRGSKCEVWAVLCSSESC